MLLRRKKTEMPAAETALPGRANPIPTAQEHHIFSRPLKEPYPPGTEKAMFGMGCFWGAERKFWSLANGIWITAVGYAGGLTPNPTYEEVCSGLTGHNEVVLVVFDPAAIAYERLLKEFWEAHDPTQGMRQGNDVGTTYRSAIYTHGEDQQEKAEASRDAYQKALEDFHVSGYDVRAVPIEKQTRKFTENPQRGKNMWVVGMLCALYNRDLETAKHEVQLIFQRKRKGDEVIALNHRLLEAGHAWAIENFDVRFEIPSEKRDEAMMVMNGNAAIALGAMAAGIEVCAMYPITP
ncbi:MAG: peptide-methionine (S)-S-oxide reductase MsrA, partial [Hyphomicrobiaceae bacterium]|nr:peptide-methionine (S)-S-oxide reductase MsrA [Hyphomicrobiaceae bacterium]